MAFLEIIQKNWIGGIIGGLVAYFFKIVSLNIYIVLIPAGILGAINILLTVLLGAVIGAFIQSLFNKK